MESKIDQGDFTLKCPIYTCNHKFNEATVKYLISDFHYNIYSKRNLINNSNVLSVKGEKEREIKDQSKNIFGGLNHKKTLSEVENNLNTIINQENKHSNIMKINSKNVNFINENHDYISNNNKLILRNYNFNNENEAPTANIISDVKNYSKKNILDVDNLKNFYKYTKNRELYCKGCNEPSLFIRPGKNSVKCLNCYRSSCKFCLKPITHDHFDLNSFIYCKVYFRRKLKIMSFNNNSTNKIKNFFISFLMIIASYILLFSNCLSFLSSILRKLMKIEKYRKRINYYYFINRHNFRKYEYITDLFDENKGTINDGFKKIKKKNTLNNTENEDQTQRKKTINFDTNFVIKISKQDTYTNQNDFQCSARSKDNRTILKQNELRCDLAFENIHKDNQYCQSLNIKSAIDKINLIDENLIKYIKIKLEKGSSLSRFRLRKVSSNPDNRGFFYFESLQKNQLFNYLEKDNKKQSSDIIIKNLRKMDYIEENKEGTIFSVIRYFFYSVFYVILGMFLIVLLLMIIPFFPLLIIIFQF